MLGLLLKNREFHEYSRDEPRDEFLRDNRDDDDDGGGRVRDLRQCSLGTGNGKGRRTPQRVLAASTSLLPYAVNRPVSTNLYPSINRVLEGGEPSFLVHIGFSGKDVAPLCRVRRLQCESVPPAAGSRRAAVHPEAVKTGDAESFLGVGVVVEVDRGVFQHAVSPGPAGR